MSGQSRRWRLEQTVRITNTNAVGIRVSGIGRWHDVRWLIVVQMNRRFSFMDDGFIITIDCENAVEIGGRRAVSVLAERALAWLTVGRIRRIQVQCLVLLLLLLLLDDQVVVFFRFECCRWGFFRCGILVGDELAGVDLVHSNVLISIPRHYIQVATFLNIIFFLNKEINC